MNHEVAMKWIAALRSGKYPKGQHYLNYKGQFCCLGVLCDLAAQEMPVHQGSIGPLIWYDGQQKTLPPTVENWAGLRSTLGRLPNLGRTFKETNASSLTEVNDLTDTDFNGIADIIESCWEEL